jgi:hypothetical protein
MAALGSSAAVGLANEISAILADHSMLSLS